MKSGPERAKVQNPVSENPASPTFFPFMEDVISSLRGLNRVQTAENYSAALNSFRRFRNGKDLSWSNFTAPLMMRYEAHLRSGGITMNTVSFYNRILRAVYNRAVEFGLTPQNMPFRHVYTGVDRTVKRAIPMKYISRIKGLDLSDHPALDLARDLFMFSFYTRGMSFVDMAFLRKGDLRGGSLTYFRRKTGQKMVIGWERCMQEIVDKHEARATGYLLPIIRREGDEHRQYRNAMRRVNKSLKAIPALIGLNGNLTMYVSRHSWASIAKNQNIPTAVISEGLGHDSELTTRIYLASLDTVKVDRANRSIIRRL